MTSHSQKFAREHPVVAFYLLAFAISWIGWIPSLAVAGGFAGFGSAPWKILLILPALGPALAAAFVLRLTGDSGGIGRRLRASFRWRVDPRWFLFALLMPPITLLAAGGLGRLVSPGAASISVPPLPASGILVFGLMSLFANPCEEIGWRGFALSRLQQRYPAAVATIVVGMLWAAWHLPIFLLPEGPISMAGVPFWPWFVDIMAHSFLMTWLYNVSGRSLLVTSLFHLTMNVSAAITGIFSYPALAAVEIVAVVILLLLSGPALGWEDVAARQ